MNTLTVELGERSYPITIEAGSLGHSFSTLPGIANKRIVIVTNETVAGHYLNPIQNALSGQQVDVIYIGDGEQYKSLATFEQVNTQLLTLSAARDTCILALGGGVVGDLAGFVAACYQRGIPFVQVPTTLLAQVDSSVGGKTAVNHPLGKNMIGAFYQPQAVVIDPETLKTLPAREFAAGMAEVIKYGVIYDADFFAWIEQNVQALQQLDPDALTYAIKRCCEIKAEIVAQDEKEAGLRALLNLGHTFGHAIEAEQGYGSWLHGEAVAAGIVIASQVAEMKNWLQASEVSRIRELLQAFTLPITKPDGMGFDSFMAHMQHDKKVEQGQIRFVIPDAIGHAVVTKDVPIEILRALLDE